jgi:8-oxo-dGTP pyrophosphatase MutT (NUDIX family)
MYKYDVSNIILKDETISQNNAKSRYCTNCSKFGHKYKFCRDPVTSYGVILIKFDYDKIKNVFNDTVSDVNMIDINSDRIHFGDIDDIKLFSILQNQIKFMLIFRKHTLGYSEFIRGRYTPENIDGIMFLFQQMIKSEINNIKKNINNFSVLWDDFWIDPAKKVLFESDYNKSKQKFEMLNNSETSEVPFDFFLDNVHPLWDQPEWGFPKGRRNKMESNIECATREFEEESNFSKNDYILLEGIRPLSEEFIGTNAIKYKHVYYIAFAPTNKEPKINDDNLHQQAEIGDIGYFTFSEILGMIRSYHVDRKKIIEKVFIFTCEKIIKELKNDLCFQYK